MSNQHTSVPRPLVRLNQWVIVSTVLLTWIFQSYWLLLIPLVSGLLGITIHYNPIMKVGKLFLKKSNDKYIPEDKTQQQFNQIVATILLSSAFLGYVSGYTTIGNIATAMVFTAAFVAICGFCIGCFIRFHWKQFQFKRRKNQTNIEYWFRGI